MLVYEAKRALILALKDPARVCNVIPKAKVIKEHKGVSFVAVKHTHEVTKVLNNMGFNAPHPIQHYYDWPGPYTPYAHQANTTEFLACNRRAYCLNGMGAMKSLSALWAFHYLKEQGEVDIAIVLAPLSTLERAWADEVFRNFYDMETVVLHGTATKRKKLIALPADVYIINHDGVTVVQDDLLRLMKSKRTVLIVDELSTMRNPRTRRWGACKALVAASTYCWGLTGTPIPNDPCNAYGQIKLITPERAPRSFTQFQDLVSRPVGPYKRIPLPGAINTIFEMMKPSIRYATRDCIDLPPTTYVERNVELSPEQAAAYKRMQREKVFQMNADGPKVIALNEAVVAIKLIQILCGAVLTGEHDEPSRIESPARIAVTKEIIAEAEGKVIVFCPVIGALDYIAEELVKEGIQVGQIDGRVPKNTRDLVFQQFQGTGVDVIVAQPSAMSHGLTLTAGSVIVWYAPCYSNETYEQANARIVRPGQRRNTLIVNIEGSELERAIYTRLKSRQKLQGAFLELCQ